jgi:hypothetical protein
MLLYLFNTSYFPYAGQKMTDSLARVMEKTMTWSIFSFFNCEQLRVGH